MSNIDDAFKETRIEHGLKQKPNWAGTVYGACQTRYCPNYHKIGYYTGGFCKKCSTRRPEDTTIPVLGSVMRGETIPIANPRITWTNIVYVLDMSDKLSEEERKIFYMTPEEREKAMDRLDYREKIEKEPWEDEEEKKEDDEDDE